jgi:hypothetical protein
MYSMTKERVAEIREAVLRAEKTETTAEVLEVLELADVALEYRKKSLDRCHRYQHRMRHGGSGLFIQAGGRP